MLGTVQGALDCWVESVASNLSCFRLPQYEMLCTYDFFDSGEHVLLLLYRTPNRECHPEKDYSLKQSDWLLPLLSWRELLVVLGLKGHSCCCLPWQRSKMNLVPILLSLGSHRKLSNFLIAMKGLSFVTVSSFVLGNMSYFSVSLLCRHNSLHVVVQSVLIELN